MKFNCVPLYFFFYLFLEAVVGVQKSHRGTLSVPTFPQPAFPAVNIVRLQAEGGLVMKQHGALSLGLPHASGSEQGT